jgi:predicted DNA-binding transcriptional regulator AlpA
LSAIETTNTDATTAPAMFSVRDFCKAHGISKAFLYKLRAQGKAPPICKLGSRSLITAEAAADWRRSLARCEQRGRTAA